MCRTIIIDGSKKVDYAAITFTANANGGASATSNDIIFRLKCTSNVVVTQPSISNSDL